MDSCNIGDTTAVMMKVCLWSKIRRPAADDAQDGSCDLPESSQAMDTIIRRWQAELRGEHAGYFGPRLGGCACIPVMGTEDGECNHQSGRASPHTVVNS